MVFDSIKVSKGCATDNKRGLTLWIAFTLYVCLGKGSSAQSERLASGRAAMCEHPHHGNLLTASTDNGIVRSSSGSGIAFESIYSPVPLFLCPCSFLCLY